MAFRPRRPRRDLDDPRALAGEDIIECAGELGIPVPDEEAEGTDPPCEVHNQVAGVPGGPCTVRVGAHFEDVHPPGRYLHDEKHIQPPEEDRVHGEEVTRQQALGWARRNVRQEVSRPRGACRYRREWRIRGTVASLTW